MTAAQNGGPAAPEATADVLSGSQAGQALGPRGHLRRGRGQVRRQGHPRDRRSFPQPAVSPAEGRDHQHTVRRGADRVRPVRRGADRASISARATPSTCRREPCTGSRQSPTWPLPRHRPPSQAGGKTSCGWKTDTGGRAPARRDEFATRQLARKNGRKNGRDGPGGAQTLVRAPPGRRRPGSVSYRCRSTGSLPVRCRLLAGTGPPGTGSARSCRRRACRTPARRRSA